MDFTPLVRPIPSEARYRAASPVHLPLLPFCHMLLFLFAFSMGSNLLGPSRLLKGIILTSLGLIFGKARDQTSSLFISFHFIAVLGA